MTKYTWAELQEMAENVTNYNRALARADNSCRADSTRAIMMIAEREFPKAKENWEILSSLGYKIECGRGGILHSIVIMKADGQPTLMVP